MTTPDLHHEPIRTCVGCRRKRPQRELLRCVLTENGPAISRTAPGRGAWICSPECLERAVARKGFDRAWRTSVPAATLAALRIAFEGVITNMEELPVGGVSPAGTQGR